MSERTINQILNDIFPKFPPHFLTNCRTMTVIIMNQIMSNTTTDKNGMILTKILKSIAPILWMCKITGILPLSTKKTNEHTTLEPKRKDWIYFLCYLMFYTGLSAYSISTVQNDSQNYKVVPKVFVEAECLIMIILELLTTSFAFAQRKHTSTCLRLLADIDGSFEKMFIKVDYAQMHKKTIALFCLMLISVFVRTILMLTTVDVDFFQQLTLFTSALIKSLLKYEFVVFVLMLRFRYKKINNSVRSFYKDNKLKPKILENAKFFRLNEVTEKLYVFCRMHYKLCNISRVLNGAFAFQLLLSIAVSLYDILFQSYYLYVAMSGRISGIKLNMIACAIAWLTDELVEVYLLVFCCASTSSCVSIIYLLFF